MILEWAYVTYHRGLTGVHHISDDEFKLAKLILERTKINIKENVEYDRFLDWVSKGR